MPAACDLKLELYAEDGATVAWEVGYGDHANPYLCAPDRYAEQEIDPASGSATIGTVSVTVIDRPTIAGDQDSGWVTARLAELGVPAIAGRRCRLRRWDGAAWVTVADGRATTPRLDSSYAAYGWEIRDTRESERKIRAFYDQPNRILVPEGSTEAYGPNGEGGYLLPAAGVVRADVFALAWPDAPPEAVTVVSTTVPPVPPSSIPTALALAGDTVPGSVKTTVWHDNDYNDFGSWTETKWLITFAGRLLLRWRPHWNGMGIPAAWQEVDPDHLYILNRTVSAPTGDASAPAPPDYNNDGPIISAFIEEGPTYGDGPTPYIGIFGGNWGDSSAVPNLPSPTDDIDYQVLQTGAPQMGGGAKPASKESPVTVEGLTAGAFLKNLYDGIYSPRGENGAVVPTGTRYDPDRLALMTDLVRIRLTEPIADGRDWAESHIYAATGWVPALDVEGRIAPVTQVPPESTVGLDALVNDNAEPSPDWNAGERIINRVVVTYQRDYRPDDPADADTGDGLSARDITLTFEDPLSIARHGIQELTIDASAFRAVGTAGDAQPLPAGIEAETGYGLAQLRGLYLLQRYALGAPAMAVAVMRSALPALRAGSWVIVDLSWFPDYVTARKGLLAQAQVLSVGELDCVWRSVLLELADAPES